MKQIILLLSLSLFFSFATFSSHAETTPTRSIKTEIQARPSTATPKSSIRDLRAPPAVVASAACCLKQCSEGGNCGQNCTVVDSLSQCGQVNFKFECGANQGLSCLGDDCSCQ